MGLASICCRLVLALLALPLVATGQTTKAPAVEAEMLDGSAYSLAAHKGEITLISVWSPESLSSRKCIGELQRFAANYAARGVSTLAASTLDEKVALRQFVAERKLSMPVAVLGDHDLGKLDEWKLPIVFVFDRNGELRGTHAGLFSMAVLERMVAPLLTP
jgi:cytochrome c biogenesis protein CcmG/thiol:disulfide interchange protein DsbE